MCQREHGCIFINLELKDHQLLTELEDTLVHELVHLKYPEKSEDEVLEMTKKLLEFPA